MRKRGAVRYEACFTLAGEVVRYRLFSSDGRLLLCASQGDRTECFDLSEIPPETVLSFVTALAESETAPCMISELWEERFP